MNEYVNLSLENIEEEHICCAIGDPKHQEGVDCKKEWIKNKLKDGHVFRKKQHGFQLTGRIMNIFIAYGLQEVSKVRV